MVSAAPLTIVSDLSLHRNNIAKSSCVLTTAARFALLLKKMEFRSQPKSGWWAANSLGL